MVSVVRRLPPVADKVHSSNNLTNGEETNNLGGSDTSQSDLLGAGVADTRQDVKGRAAGWAAGGGEEVLVVGLEGGQVAIRCQQEVLLFCSFVVSIVGNPYGGDMFWPRNTSLPSSSPTLE